MEMLVGNGGYNRMQPRGPAHRDAGAIAPKPRLPRHIEL